MIISWLVYCLLVSALVSAAAWLGERASRAQGWPGRWAWAGALAATVAFPVWAWLTPSPEPVAAGPLPGAYVMEALPPLVLEPTSSAGLSLEALLVLAWSAASGLLLLWLAVSAARLRAAERGWGETELDGVRVLVSERTGPAAMGVLRGKVVLPRWALGLDERLRRLMVLHEAEHVRAGDPQLAVAGLVVCALMPWNLPVWWQLRRLRLAMEMDCDARVLRRSGDDVRGYGALLLEVAQGRPRLALGLAETKSSLERRIRMITRTTTGRRTLQALGLAAISGLVLAVACETPGPTDVALEPESPRIELNRIEAREDGCMPALYVNGRGEAGTVEALSERLDPKEIERIEVVKGAAAESLPEQTSCGAISILTKDATAAERAAVERLFGATRQKVGEARSAEELAAGPTFTPMTQRPQLTNAGHVRQRLQELYPPLLKAAGIGGTANVWFFIDAGGEVAKLQVNESSGHDALDQAALKVAGEMAFVPARLEGEPVPVWIALDITFESRAAAEPARAEPRADSEPAGQAVLRERAAPSPVTSELAREPTFTPMTERPRLRNSREVSASLMSHYPPLLRDAGIGGVVNTWLLIDQAGRVVKTAVNASSGYPALDAAALRVAREMEFTPARNREAVVPVWVALDITFEVQQ